MNPPDGSQAVLISYTNYRGQTSQRTITPLGPLYWGSTQYHPEPQWLFDAWDHTKGQIRSFAFRGLAGVMRAEHDNGQLVTGNED